MIEEDEKPEGLGSGAEMCECLGGGVGSSSMRKTGAFDLESNRRL